MTVCSLHLKNVLESGKTVFYKCKTHSFRRMGFFMPKSQILRNGKVLVFSSSTFLLRTLLVPLCAIFCCAIPKFRDFPSKDAASIGATIVRFIFITKSANGICTDLTGFSNLLGLNLGLRSKRVQMNQKFEHIIGFCLFQYIGTKQ